MFPEDESAVTDKRWFKRGRPACGTACLLVSNCIQPVESTRPARVGVDMMPTEGSWEIAADTKEVPHQVGLGTRA